MNTEKSQLARVIAGGYLLLTFVSLYPLIQDGYVGHGNGLLFMIAAVLTAPVSVLLLLLTDALFDWNAFYLRGWPHVLLLSELAAGALVNAAVVHRLVAFVHRWWVN
jgi:hypothetical protein